MANHSSKETKIRIIELFSEGLGIRSIARLTRAHKETIFTLRTRTAAACRKVMDEKFQKLTIAQLQLDELWTFVASRHRPRSGLSGERGPAWTFVALDPKTKLIPAFITGDRTELSATRFTELLRSRMADDCQLSTDGLAAYVCAIESTNAKGCWTAEDYRHLGHVRTLGVTGRATTNHVETHNGNIRQHVSMMRRRTRGFAKTRSGLNDQLSIYFFNYNFIKIHGSLGRTPAQAAKVSYKRWTWEDLLHYAGEPGFARIQVCKRGKYKPRDPKACPTQHAAIAALVEKTG